MVQHACNVPNKTITTKDQDFFLENIKKQFKKNNIITDIYPCLTFISQNQPFTKQHVITILGLHNTSYKTSIEYRTKKNERISFLHTLVESNKLDHTLLRHIVNLDYTIDYLTALTKPSFTQSELTILLMDGNNIRHILYRPDKNELNTNIEKFRTFLNKHNLILHQYHLEIVFLSIHYGSFYINKIIQLFHACRYQFTESDSINFLKSRCIGLNTSLHTVLQLFNLVYKLNDNIFLTLVQTQSKNPQLQTIFTIQQIFPH